MSDIIPYESTGSIGMLVPAMEVAQVVIHRKKLVSIIKSAMTEGVDYGVLPGVKKPSLWKPGAEKLCLFFGLTPTFETIDAVRDWTGTEHNGEPFIQHHQKCKLWRGPYLVSSGDGSCNSWEKKYRYREAKRICPHCKQATIIKGREEYGGGWLCHKKQGGCGAKFADGDAVIEQQQVGLVPNEDVADLDNTLLKMAQKRSYIASVIFGVAASEFFTQDLESLPDYMNAIDADSHPVPVKQQPQPQSTDGLEHKAASATTQQPQRAPEPNGKDPVTAFWKAVRVYGVVNGAEYVTRAGKDFGKALELLEQEHAKAIEPEPKPEQAPVPLPEPGELPF